MESEAGPRRSSRKKSQKFETLALEIDQNLDQEEREPVKKKTTKKKQSSSNEEEEFAKTPSKKQKKGSAKEEVQEEKRLARWRKSATQVNNIVFASHS
jgi:hypothetical protein